MQVRGLPCAHNFHVECIDEWLRLNVKCPRCRCSVFPNLDLSALSNIRTDPERSTNIVTRSRYIRNQPPSQSYLLRLQSLLSPAHAGSAVSGEGTETGSMETPTNGAQPAVPRGLDDVEHLQVLVEGTAPPRI